MNTNRGNPSAPRGRGHSGGNRRAARDAQRDYQHYHDTQQQRDWANEPAPYDPRREVNHRPTPRTTVHQQRNKKPDNRPIQTVEPDTAEVRDEPLYDIGPHSSMVPIRDCFAQNFEFSGFVPLLHQTYEKMLGVDPLLQYRLPQSMFAHAMATHLNLEVLESARKTGQNVLNLGTDAREILPDYQVVPQPIADYISHITDTITPDGEVIKLNLPEVAIPGGPVFENGVQIAESGTFGALNAQTHNAYECYISPYVTSARVLATAGNNADYAPLPGKLIAGNLVPNRNLLGFEPIDVQKAGTQARLQGIQFPNDETLEGRYRYSALLQTRVYTILAELKDRFKMLEIRRENNPQGLNVIKRISKKISAVNQTFVESSGPIDDAQVPLYERNVNIHSFGAQGSSINNQSNIEVLHRRRVLQGREMAGGFCCLTEAGLAPEGWVATGNDNFNMEGQFAIVLHFDYEQLRQSHYSSHGPAGIRLNALANFIERNYYLKK